MAREIKFRVWDGEGKMLTWEQVKHHGAGWLLNQSQVKKPMQYTGLKDRHGREIYEGDVIRSFDSNGNAILHSIRFVNEEAMFAAVHVPPHEFSPTCGVKQRWITEFSKEVIGNIHEHPHLLAPTIAAENPEPVSGEDLERKA